MDRRFEHTLGFQVTVLSQLKSGADIDKQQVMNAIINDIDEVFDQALPPLETRLLPFTQAEFRNNAELCPRCGHDKWVKVGSDARDNCLYQTRICNKCDESWTVCFAASNYISNTE